jgi:hypothetical protein
MFPVQGSHVPLVVYDQSCLRFVPCRSLWQFVVMEKRANIKFCSKTDKTATEKFPANKTGLWWQRSLIHRFLNGLQDFRAAVKMSKVMNAVDDQKPFEHLKRLKQFGNWFQLIVKWLFEWWKRNLKLAEKQPESLSERFWKMKDLCCFLSNSWPMSGRFSDCKPVKSLFSLWMKIVPCLTQL